MFWRRRPEQPQPASPYQKFVVEEMILRDHLAVDRTSLANERTFLAYMRTALACVIGGASGLHFLTGSLSDLFGGSLIAAGLVATAYGTYRYRWYKRRIDMVISRSALPQRPEDSEQTRVGEQPTTV